MFVITVLAGLGVYALFTAGARPAHAEAARPEAAHRQHVPQSLPGPSAVALTGTLGVPDVPDGYMIIEGDIQVPLDYFTQHTNMPQATYSIKQWPGGIVKYTFDSNVTAVSQTLMLNAMADWEQVANVHFQPCSLCNPLFDDFIWIRNSSGNNSPVGVQGGTQIVNIASWDAEFVMAHELGHTLGFWHEQSRFDRSDYVIINTANVTPGVDIDANWGIQGPGYGPYDFDSVMQYGQYDFSKCPPYLVPSPSCPTALTTIDVKAPYNTTWQNLIGQRDHLSTWDAMVMSFLYAQANWIFVDPTYTGMNEYGTFLKPYHDFSIGYYSVPTGGTLWILQPGTFSTIRVFKTPMTIQAPLGGVVLK